MKEVLSEEGVESMEPGFVGSTFDDVTVDIENSGINEPRWCSGLEELEDHGAQVHPSREPHERVSAIATFRVEEKIAEVEDG